MAIIISGASGDTTDLETLVLKKLKVLDAEEAAEPADAEEVADAYNRLYEELLNENLVNWANGEEIPSWSSNPIADIIAHRLSGTFHVPQQDNQMLLYNHDLGWRTMRRQLTPDYVSESRFEYY